MAFEFQCPWYLACVDIARIADDRVLEQDVVDPAKRGRPDAPVAAVDVQASHGDVASGHHHSRPSRSGDIVTLDRHAIVSNRNVAVG